MADLTPDEVMAKHQPIWATIGVAEVDACGRCSCVPTDGLSVKTFTLWPCDAYLMAERAQTAEARVKELEIYAPCEACRNLNHEQCTGDCTSLCCALDLSEARVTELEAVVRDAVALIESGDSRGKSFNAFEARGVFFARVARLAADSRAVELMEEK